MATEHTQVKEQAARATPRQMVYWMAVFTTSMGVLYLLGLLGRLTVDGTVHSVSAKGVRTLSATIALLWDVGLLILFAALRRKADGGEGLFADLALVFMMLVCATSSINWFVQLAVVPRFAPTSDAAALLDAHNEMSITYAMEHLGWGLFFGLSALFAAASMGSGRLETWIRWTLAAAGTLSLLHLLGVIVASPRLGDMGYIAWGVLLPAVALLLAMRFGKDRSRADYSAPAQFIPHV